jgi:hypothetical protein
MMSDQQLKWEIESMERMDEKSKALYSLVLIEKYEEYMDYLGRERKEHNIIAFESIAWRAGLIGGAVCAFAGPCFAAYAKTLPMEIVGGSMMLLSLVLIPVSFVNSVFAEMGGQEGIKRHIDAAKENKKQIDEIKARIDQLKQLKVSI